jgi:small multidrug resistance pump
MSAKGGPVTAPPAAPGGAEHPQPVFEVEPGAHDPLADLAAAAGASIDERLHRPRRRRARLAAYAWLLLAIVAGVTGTSALSASAGFTRPGPIAVLAVAYLICFLSLTRALEVIAVGVAYAIWSGIGITLVTLIGWHAFGQKLSAGQLAGIALILVGVVVIQLFSRTRGDD